MSPRPVIFVQPLASFDNPAPCLDDKQYGLGILANAAWLKSKGFPVEGHHLPLDRHRGKAIEDSLDSIVESNPLLVAIGLNWVHFSDGAIETARRLKARAPGLAIVVGGQHASLFAAEIAGTHTDCIDGVIQGEAEVPLLTICQTLQDTGEMPDDVPGLHRPNRPSATQRVVEDMEALPTYSYRTFQSAPLQRDVGAPVDNPRGLPLQVRLVHRTGDWTPSGAAQVAVPLRQTHCRSNGSADRRGHQPFYHSG